MVPRLPANGAEPVPIATARPIDSALGAGKCKLGAWVAALVFGLSMAMPSHGQDHVPPSRQNTIESILSTALILTDSQTISVGLRAFDPSAFGPFDGGDPSGGAIERRRSVTTYDLPLSWQLTDDEDARLKTTLKAELSYVRFERDVVLNDVENPAYERNKDSVYAAFAASQWTYQINQWWRARTSLGLHILSHKSQYQGDASALPINPQRALLNVNNTAAIGEWAGGLIYSHEDSHLPWQFDSLYSYYYGRTIGGSDELQRVRPETWSWSNGFTLRWHQPKLWNTPNQLRLSAHRVELGGDVVDTFDTHSYYELAIGWLFDTDDDIDWLKNIGLSVSLNVGSSLSGGSLVLLYNEEY